MGHAPNWTSVWVVGHFQLRVQAFQAVIEKVNGFDFRWRLWTFLCPNNTLIFRTTSLPLEFLNSRMTCQNLKPHLQQLSRLRGVSPSVLFPHRSWTKRLWKTGYLEFENPSQYHPSPSPFPLPCPPPPPVHSVSKSKAIIAREMCRRRKQR